MPPPKYVPKHRNAPVQTAQVTPAGPSHRGEPTALIRKSVRNAAFASGVAVAATGIAVSTGLISGNGPLDGAAVALSSSGHTPHLTDADLAARDRQTSRSSDARPAVATNLKTQALSDASGVARTRTADLRDADPQTLARALMPQYGMSSAEFSCLDNIWSQESRWNVHADNPSSSAYGIPQALPGSKMSSAGPNWESNPETQIRWGLGYIKARYGTACSAWSFKQSHGWY